MINLIRSEVPPVFYDPIIKIFKKEAKDFYSLTKARRSQRKHFFHDYLVKSEFVHTTLSQMSHEKCFYCEVKLHEQNVAIDHFRPTQGALNLQRSSFSPDHYWWLTYEWFNLNLSCNSCSQSKGNRFPVMGKRAKILATEKNLSKENILILDPCGIIPVEEHLYFNERGEVKGKSDIGEISINVYGLNRNDLISKRRNAILKLYILIKDKISKTGFSDLNSTLLEFASNREEFSQAKTQLIKHWYSDVDYYFAKETPQDSDFKLPEFKIPIIERLELPLNIPSFSLEKVMVPVDQEELNKEVELIGVISKAYLIERIHISNFKSIDHLDMSISANSKDKTSWLMLLGENGVGKTSILQAISLALSGSENLDDLNLDPKRFIRKGQDNQEAMVRVFLSGEMKPVTLKITEKGFVKESVPEGLILLGYGATRIFNHTEEVKTHMFLPYIKNLFDPLEKLSGIKSWLLSLDNDNFNKVARAFKDILSLDEKGIFVRVEGNVLFKRGKNPVELMQLSDGYQSLIAMTGHLMMSLLREWPSLDVAEGIVLIDEIGVHMHPSWKMRIVTSLRNAFPRVQFICTTHDPLCLRGLDGREVEVLEYNRKLDKIYFRSNLPDITGMRIDQILTSEHFGLNSTLDPELEQNYVDYYALLSKPKKTKEDEAKIRKLQVLIDEVSVLGGTRREREAMHIIDQYIAEEKLRVSTTNKSSSLRQETKNKIRKLFG